VHALKSNFRLKKNEAEKVPARPAREQTRALSREGSPLLVLMC
jgi:hypothetical protein